MCEVWASEESVWNFICLMYCRSSFWLRLYTSGFVEKSQASLLALLQAQARVSGSPPPRYRVAFLQGSGTTQSISPLYECWGRGVRKINSLYCKVNFLNEFPSHSCSVWAPEGGGVEWELSVLEGWIAGGKRGTSVLPIKPTWLTVFLCAVSCCPKYF